MDSKPFTSPALPNKTDRGSKTGSNVRDRGLAQHHSRRFAKITSTLAQHHKQYGLELAQLVPPSERRAALAVSERVRAEQNATSFTLGPDAAAWRKNRVKYRQQMARELAKSVSGFGKVRALGATDKTDFHRLALPVSFQSGSLQLGGLPPLQSSSQVFKPPFPVFDVSHRNGLDHGRNDSFALPRIGHIINDLSASQSEHLSLPKFYGARGTVFNRVGCGFNFTMPRRGRLHLIAEFQHLFDRVRLTLSDNFGFSGGHVTAAIFIYLDIVRGDDVFKLGQRIMFEGLVSHGSDLTTVFPSPKIGTIFTLDATTEKSFRRGANLQILAGCEVFGAAAIDDMAVAIDALIWHDVKQVAVDVV